MILLQYVTAYVALVSLNEEEMDYKSAYNTLMLKRKITPHAEFYLRKERELMNEYAARDEEGNIIARGSEFIFADEGKISEYNARRMMLGAIEVDGEVKPATIRAPKTIKPMTIEALEGFVIFEEGDG